jgi:hypothetical protein
MTRGALAAASTFDAKISILKAIEAMTRTKLQTAILITAVLAVPLALQWIENNRLRESLDALAQRSGPTMPMGADHSEANDGAKILAKNQSSERAGVAEPDAAALGSAAADRESDAVEWKRALFLTDPLQRSQRLSELLARLRAEDAPAIAAGFEEARAGGVQFAEEHRLFLRAWGKIGGVAAVEHALKQNGQGSAEAVAALGGWASKSAGPARAWLEALPENEAKDALVYGLLDGWSTTDFAAAAAYAESRPVSPARDRFRELLLERALRSQGVGGAQDWVRRIPEDEHNREYKKRAFGEVVQAMLYRDPAAAARWISEMDGRNFVDAEIVTSTAAKLAESSPTGALQWLAGLKPADANGVAKGAGTVLQQWAQQDPQAAGTWLQQNTAHPFYDRLALGYVRSVVSTDRDGASKWAETIRNEELRVKATAALAPQTLISESFINFTKTKGGNGGTLTLTSGLIGAGEQTLVLDADRGNGVRLNEAGEEPHELAMEKAIYAATIAKAADLTIAKKNPHPAGPQWKNCAQCHAQ